MSQLADMQWTKWQRMLVGTDIARYMIVPSAFRFAKNPIFGYNGSFQPIFLMIKMAEFLPYKRK